MCLVKKVIMELHSYLSINIENVKLDLILDDLKQSRIICGDIEVNKKKIKLINIYVPNGNPVNTEKYEYKKKWLSKFLHSIIKIIQDIQ